VVGCEHVCEVESVEQSERRPDEENRHRGDDHQPTQAVGVACASWMVSVVGSR
jgi:hypothetical protein